MATNTSENTAPATMETSMTALFNTSNFMLFAWFLAIYFVAYFLIGAFYNKGSTQTTFQSSMGRMVDFMVLGVIIVYLFTTFTTYTEKEREQMLYDFFTNMQIYFNYEYSLLISGIFILIFYIGLYVTGVPMGYDTKPMTVSFIETLAWIVFIILLFCEFFKYVLKISLPDAVAKIHIMNNPSDKNVHVTKDASGNIDTSGNHAVQKKNNDGNEVFNISNNLYTYDDAQAICSAYDAELATYDQVEAAYNDGGEWCNYGWSAGQMILFPTQKLSWDKLQSKKGHEHSCGRPGVNGGYIENPYVKFGVNCYGKKPKPSDSDLARMNARQNQVYPSSPADIALDAKLKYWKDNAAQLLQLNSYNKKKWSEY
jgi:hypothetical protein